MVEKILPAKILKHQIYRYGDSATQLVTLLNEKAVVSISYAIDHTKKDGDMYILPESMHCEHQE